MSTLAEQQKKVAISIAALADRKNKISEAVNIFTARYDELIIQIRKALDDIEYQKSELEKIVSGSVKKLEEMATLTSGMESKMTAIDDLLHLLKSLE